jgi:tetratricopeptide (TPR) repeat protein
VQVKASEAWINFGKGNNETAITLMREAADMEDKVGKHPKTPSEVLPARELLGDMMLMLNKPKEALEAYEIDLDSHPNRLNGIYGAAIAAKKIGDMEKAKMYFESLQKLTEGSDSERSEVEEAKVFLSQI